MNPQNKQSYEPAPLAIEAPVSETLKLSELWRKEPWARISSNTVYGLEKNDSVGEKQRLKARDDFIQGTAEQPELNFPKLDIHEIGAGLTRFDSMISQLKMHPDDDPLLFQSVSRKIAELSRHRYVIEAAEATSEQDRQTYLGYAETLSVDEFGDVEPAKFNGLLQDLRNAAAHQNTDIATELLALLPDVDPTIETLTQETVTPETIAKLAPLVHQLLRPAFDIIAELPEGEIEHEQSVKIFQSMIDAQQLTGVRAELTTGNALDADGFQMMIGLGRNRKKLTKESFGMVGIHELIHIMGSYEGRMQMDDLSSIGLPDSLSFEEGKCVAIEQILNGKGTKRGEIYYLGLGLLRGTIDGKKRTFREVYEVLWRRALVNETAIDDTAVDSAKKDAYQATMRITRGQATDTRDLAYFVGNETASHWFNKIAKLPTEQSLAVLHATLVTKADPTKPEHLAYLQEHHSKWRALNFLGVE